MKRTRITKARIMRASPNNDAALVLSGKGMALGMVSMQTCMMTNKSNDIGAVMLAGLLVGTHLVAPSPENDEPEKK